MNAEERAKVAEKLYINDIDNGIDAYNIGRNDAIEEYSCKLFSVIEKCTVNCKFDFNIDDLHNLEIVIKGLAEEMKEGYV